jgi:hypothetical protein
VTEPVYRVRRRPDRTPEFEVGQRLLFPDGEARTVTRVYRQVRVDGDGLLEVDVSEFDVIWLDEE